MVAKHWCPRYQYKKMGIVQTIGMFWYHQNITEFPHIANTNGDQYFEWLACVAKLDAATAVLQSVRYERALATSALASASWPCMSAMAVAGVVCDIVLL